MAYERSENFLNAFTTFQRAAGPSPFVWKRPIHVTELLTEVYESRQVKEKSQNSYVFKELRK